MSPTRRMCLALASAVMTAASLIAGPIAGAQAAPAPDTSHHHVRRGAHHDRDLFEQQLSASARTAAPAPAGALCTTPVSFDKNVLADCDQPDSPHNEPAVAVDPHNPLHFVEIANDYTYSDATHRKLISQSHVSFDAGRSWATWPLPYPAECTFTGDPTLSFDGAGTLYFGTICIDTESILLTTSRDGGRTWSPMVTVAAGTGDVPGEEVVGHDHPQLAAWGNGNVIVTWVQYHYTDDSESQITTVPVVAAVSHDGGQHFGAPQDVGGSSAQCVSVSGRTGPNGPICDGTWGNAVTVVAKDGTIYATFYNTARYRADGVTNLGRDTHFAVRLDPATGALKPNGGPFTIGLAYDGIDEGDLPVNVDGRQTLHDSQLRTLGQGNITADPLNPKHIAVVWFDNRSGVRPVPADPYAAQTDSDIVVSQSFNGGTTWSAPAAIRIPGDQFFPWAAYDGLGRLRVGFLDRSYDPANHSFGFTLATEKARGSLTFNRTQVSTALSDPTRDNRWSVTTANPAFPAASRFIGDYIGVGVFGPLVMSAWIDQRRQSNAFGVSGHGENTFTAVTG